MIIGLIVLNVIPRTEKRRILDKSIAVLPFESLSNDLELQYQADGIMDAILLHLSKIEDLRVMSRTSVEQYRDTKMTVPEICQDLGVSYVLEGSFQKSGDQIRLIVQLIQTGTEGHVWANNYDREWKDIFAVQSEVAKAVAGELQAVITPLEQQRIEKIPTTNLTAYDYYIRGMDEMWNNNDQRAEELFNEALRYDPTYAEAYVSIGVIYANRFLTQNYFSNSYQDTALILIDKALSYDEELSSAHSVKAAIFQISGKLDQALSEYEKAVEFNPNDWLSQAGIASFYSGTDYVKYIDYLNHAVRLNHGIERPGLLQTLGLAFLNAGLIDKAYDYLTQALELDGDSGAYFYQLAQYENFCGNHTQSIVYCQEALKIDSAYSALFHLGWNYYKTGRYDESLKYIKSALEKVKDDPIGQYYFYNNYHRVAYAFWRNGYFEEAEHYFDLQLESLLSMIEMERPAAQNYYAYYDLAAVYAFKGEKEKALENLRIFNQRKIYPFLIVELMERDELFDSIRDEPEFQQIVRDVEAKYQAEHERVRQWLEENEML